MAKIIEIKSINQHQKNDVLEVVYEIGVNDSSFLLEYQISGSWEGEIAAYCDSPIVSFLYDALLNGYDFKSEYPISEKDNKTKQLFILASFLKNIFNQPVTEAQRYNRDLLGRQYRERERWLRYLETEKKSLRQHAIN